MLGRFKEGEREFLVLKAQPPARGPDGLHDESLRAWGEAWTEAKIWIDPATDRIERIAFRRDTAAAGPTEQEWRYEFRRTADGLPSEIRARHEVLSRPDLGSSWRFEFRAAKVEPADLRVPEDRIARDWVLRPEAEYEERLRKDPKDAAAWLGLGSLRLQRHEGNAGECFRKAIELRPGAVEGYAGLLFVLERGDGDPVPLLEKAVAAGVTSAVVHLELAHRKKDRAHFEAALKLAGEDAEVLVDAASLTGRDDLDRRRLLERAIRAERAPTSAYGLWKQTHPGPAERLDLFREYEKVLNAGRDASWIRARMVDLAVDLRQDEEARLHAAAGVSLLERRLGREDRAAVERLFQFFKEARDFDGAWRLQAAVAAWTDEDWPARATSLECRLRAAREGPDALLRFFDERFAPADRGRADFAPLVRALKEEKQLDAVVAKLLQTPADHPFRSRRGELLEKIAADEFSGSGQKDLAIKAREMRAGTKASGQDLVALGWTLTYEKKWAEARAKAGELLARGDATPQHRADANRILASAWMGEGQPARAVEACDAALRETDAAYRVYAHLLKGQALLAQGEIGRAVEAYQAGFEDRKGTPGVLFKEIPRQVAEKAAWKAVLERAARSEPSLGAIAVLAMARSAEGDAAGAADAIERAPELRPGEVVFVRERLRYRSAALRAVEAMADRALFYRLLGEDASRWPWEDREAIDRELLRALEARNDVARIKDYARTLADDYLTPRVQSEAMSQALQAVREEAFFEEIEARILKKAEKPYHAILVSQLLVLAWDRMGWHDRAIERCDKILGAPDTPKRDLDLARSWRAGFERNKAGWIDPVAELVRRAKESGERDPLRALERAAEALRSSPRLVLADRTWRAALRTGKGDLLHFQLGAARGASLEERLRCLEAVVERAPEAHDWRLALAVARSRGKGGEEGVGILVEALGKVPAGHPSAVLLLDEARRRPAGEARALGEAFEKAGAFAPAHELAAAHEDRLRIARKWRAAAAGGERARAIVAEGAALAALDRPEDALDALAEVDLSAFPELRGEGETRRARLLEEERRRLNEIAQSGDRKDLVRALHRAVRRPGTGRGDVERYAYVLAARGGRILDFTLAWEEFASAEKPSPGAALFLARLHELAGQWGEVRRVLEAGAKAFPEEASFSIPLGRARMREEDFAGAALAFEAALARGPVPGESYEVRASLVRCYAWSGRSEAAAAELRLLEREGHRSSLAQLAVEAKLHAEAVRLYRAALEGEPSGAGRFRLGLGRSLRALGDVRAAEAEFRAVVRDHPDLAAGAAPDLFELLPAERRAFEMARVLVGALRTGRDLFSALAVAVPEKERAAVLEAWDDAAGAGAAEQAAASSLILTWGGDPKKALLRLRAAERLAPDSIPILLEAERVLSHVGTPREQARVQERLAELDPEGKAGGHPAGVRRLTALGMYLQVKTEADVTRVAIQVLYDPAVAPGHVEARRALREVLGQLDEAGWLRLRKLALPAPDAKTAERARALVLDLGDDDFEKRRAARRALHRIGAPALPSLLPLVDHDDLDLRTNARGAIEDILGRDP